MSSGDGALTLLGLKRKYYTLRSHQKQQHCTLGLVKTRAYWFNFKPVLIVRVYKLNTI